MKLLIVTQKVDKNDPILGFFHRWLEEFSKHCEKLTVICLEKGEYDLPENTKVLSLGKEFYHSGLDPESTSVTTSTKAGIQGETINTKFGPIWIPAKLKYLFNFYKYIKQEEGNYDHVFVHMNPIYVILGAIFWKTWDKKISLWYVHKSVDLKLRIAELFADNIFTVSKETFNLPSEKVKIVGHGIPLHIFEKPKDYKRKDDKFRIVSVGRITPIKNLDVLIKTADLLHRDILNLEVVIVGGPTQKGDEEYFDKLKKMVTKERLEKVVRFAGSVPNHKIKEHYWNSDISVNLCPTGGVDKTVLESMASGMPVFASNKAFEAYFGEYKDELIFKQGDSRDLADKILKFKNSQDSDKITAFLLESVKQKASLESLIKNIVSLLSS